MSYGMASANRVTWSASRGAYSQRRLMLWAADTAGATVEGRRFMPPAGSGGGTQPGRERPHPRRCVPGPSACQGVAHVPAAESRSFSAFGTQSPRAVHQRFAPDNHTADRRARCATFGRTSKARSCVRRGVECRSSNHGPEESRSSATSRDSIERTAKRCTRTRRSLESPPTTC